jgi:hypothetical protein
MKKRKTEVFDDGSGDTLSFQPLSMFTLLVSAASLLNSQARYLEANLETLQETGGYNATTDCEQAAGFLLAVVDANTEKFMSQQVKVPKGWGYVAMSIPILLDEKRGELPF